MDLSERYRLFLENLNITSYELEKIAGIDQGTSSKILNGITKKISPKTIKRISEHFEIDEKWLRFGGDTQIKSSISEVSLTITNEPESKYYCPNCNNLKEEIKRKDSEIGDLYRKLYTIVEMNPGIKLPEGVPKRSTG